MKSHLERFLAKHGHKLRLPKSEHGEQMAKPHEEDYLRMHESEEPGEEDMAHGEQPEPHEIVGEYTRDLNRDEEVGDPDEKKLNRLLHKIKHGHKDKEHY